MTTRKIIGFNDEMEFLVVNDQIQVIDNGPLYKNKLRNGLLIDTLCEMEVRFEQDIYENEVEKVKEKRCNKINYDTEEIDDELIKYNMRRRNKNNKNKIINEREKRRRDKRKMLKVGNDCKMNQYNEDIKKVFNKVLIPTNHFGKKEIDKYAPLCSDCFIFAMLSKRYYILYKCSYNKTYCKHFKCWMCNDEGNRNKFCCIECHDNWRSITKYEYLLSQGLRRRCNCGEEYGYDYGKKYKCGTYFGFDFNTNINYDHHLDHNGNTIIEINDESINFEPLLCGEKQYFTQNDALMYDSTDDTDDDTCYNDLDF